MDGFPMAVNVINDGALHGKWACDALVGLAFLHETMLKCTTYIAQTNLFICCAPFNLDNVSQSAASRPVLALSLHAGVIPASKDDN